jgi:cation diffusion facilitator family transporter
MINVFPEEGETVIQDKYVNLKLGERGALISIVAYIILSAFKLIIGQYTGSQALRADGLNNTTDIVASIAVLIGLRISQRPPDSDHPYGHWRSETISSLIASLIMFAVGLNVLYDAATTIFHGHEQTPDSLAAWVGISAGIIMYFVYRFNKKLALKISSSSVLAAAKDNLSDAWVSFGTAAGIFAAQLGFPWLDTVTAFIVGLLICKTGWDIFKEAAFNLSDGFDDKKITDYADAVRQMQGVEGVASIRARKYGNNTALEMVILVAPVLGLKEADAIATRVEKYLVGEFHIMTISVHVEPNLKKEH